VLLSLDLTFLLPPCASLYLSTSRSIVLPAALCCCIAPYTLESSTYSPVPYGGVRWWLDVALSALFAADYALRISVRAASYK
jgi:hypothetical protein